MNQSTDPIQWLHHGASILCGVLLNSFHWCSDLDRFLFACAGINAWSMLAINFPFYFAMGVYHLSTSSMTKKRVAVFNMGYIPVTVLLMHLSLLSFLVRNWARFEHVYVPLIIVAIDAAFIVEHVYTIYVLRRMRMKRMEDTAEEQDENGDDEDEEDGDATEEDDEESVHGVDPAVLKPTLLGRRRQMRCFGGDAREVISSTLQPSIACEVAGELCWKAHAIEQAGKLCWEDPVNLVESSSGQVETVHVSV